MMASETNQTVLDVCSEEAGIYIEMSPDLTQVTGKYTEEQYKKLKQKADRYLLPLMWLCYGIVSLLDF